MTSTPPSFPGDGGREAIALVLAAAEDELDIAPRSAEARLERIEPALTARSDPELVARAAGLRGALAARNGRFQMAVAAWQRARHSWLSAGRALDARMAALGRTEVLLQLGEYDDVIDAVERLQAGVDATSEVDDAAVTRVHLRAHRQLGEARVGRGDHRAAQHHYDLAENLALSMGETGAAAEVARRRGVALLDAGHSHRGLDELLRAREQFVSIGRGGDATRCLVSVVRALAMTGQVARALELADRIGPELEDNHLDRAALALTRSWALLCAGLPDEAHAEATRAQEAFVDLGMVERSARAGLVRGCASMRALRWEQASGELSAAERLFTGCGARLIAAETRLARAGLALAAGDAPAARHICAQLLVAAGDDPRHVTVRAGLLQARATDDADAAETLLAEAARSVAASGEPELRLELALARARHHGARGDLTVAAAELRRALTAGRSWEGAAPGRHGGLTRTLVADTTEELVAVLLAQGEHAAVIEAWQQVAAAKARVLHRLADRTIGWCPEDGGGSLGRIDDLLEQARRPGAARPGDTVASLPQVPEGPVVEYYVLGEDLVVFVIREGQVHVRRLSAVVDETRRRVAGWQQECVLVAATGEGDGDGASPSLDALYDLLLDPVADLLSDLQGEQLEVVAHRHLHVVPFDALLDVAGPWRNRVAPAARGATAAHRAEAATPVVSPVVLAVPDEHAPAVETEAAMILREFPAATVLVGADATAAALAERGGKAGIVHLACHGTFRSGNPLFSAVRLGDGWLPARDLVNGCYDLGGSVVVLSACASGQSSDHSIEPMGLAWACLAAGADAVVASLWPVDDEVTLELMTHFYRGLAAGLSVATALCRARSAVADSRPHPYYWAPFRLFSSGG